MAIEPGRWLKLTPAIIEGIPDAPGVFEIANLVRSVLFIGRGHGSIQSQLASLGAVPANLPASIGGYMVRYELTPDEEQVLADRTAAYAARHEGHPPVGNESGGRRHVRLVTRKAA